MNKELKNEFINNLNGGSNVYWAIKKVVEIEKTKNKDLKDFDTNDIIDVLSTMKNIYQFSKMKTTIRLYKEYCATLGLEIEEVDWENNLLSLSSYKNDMEVDENYITPSEYKSILSMFDVQPDPNLGKYYKCIFMCIYNGILGDYFDDLLHLRLEDFEDDKVKLYSGKTIVVEHDLKNLLAEVKDINQYTHKNNRCHSLGENIYGGCIKFLSLNDKGKEQKKYANKLRMALSRNLCNMLGVNYSIRAICKSGMINYVVENSIDEILHKKSPNTVFMEEIMKKKGLEIAWPQYLYKYKNEIKKCVKDLEGELEKK